MGRGLYDNIRARQASGKPPRKKGQKPKEEMIQKILISVPNQLQAEDYLVAQRSEVSNILDPNLLLIEEEH